LAVIYFKEFGMNKCSALRRRALSILGILSLVLTSTIVSPPVIIAQEAAPSTQEPAKPSATADLPPLPLSPVEKAERDKTSLRLSLKDVTKLALQNNLDIAIEDTNEAASQQKIIQAYGAYDPAFNFSLGVNSRKSANTNLASASSQASYSTSKTFNWDLSFSQPVKSGGTFEANLTSRRNSSDQAFQLLNPSYGTTAAVSFTQPLLRNFRVDSNRTQIKLRNLDLKLSDSQFKKTVTDKIADIQSQYWELVSAIRDFDIKRNSVKLGQITLRDNRKKVEVGTLAPIGITEAEAELARRELNLISSEETILRQENALRQLISNDRKSDIWNKVIIPTDSPDFQEYKVGLETAIEAALKNRPELEQYDIQINQSDLNLQNNRNSRKWKVDLVGQFGSGGDAGTPRPNSNQPDIRIGGLGTAWYNLFTEGLTNWSLSVDVSVPLRNRNADSQIAQQQISIQQQIMQRKNMEQSIQVEIRNAIQQLDTNRKQVDTAKKSKQLSQEQLDGEQKRFQAGLSENFRVLDRQDQLAQAEASELQNLINYKKSVINLQKAMNSLLEANEFEIAKERAESIATAK
jgi:outer membrane protein